MKEPLRGLWHKHYYHPGFFVRNLIDETERMGKDGRWEKMFAPHYGKYVHEFIGQLAYQAIDERFAHKLRIVLYHCKFRRNVVAQDQSTSPLHHEENGS